MAVAVLTKTKKDLQEENELLRSQINEMNSKIDMLLNGSQQPINKREIITANDRVLVTCYILGKNAFVLNGKTITFQKLGSSHTLGILEINDLVLNDKYKSQVESGLVVFKDDKWYEHFGILKPIPLTDENFKNILLNDTISKFDELSQFKRDEIILHELMYRTAQLIKRHKVTLEFNKISELEKYFNVKFDTLVALVDDII